MTTVIQGIDSGPANKDEWPTRVAEAVALIGRAADIAPNVHDGNKMEVINWGFGKTFCTSIMCKAVFFLVRSTGHCQLSVIQGLKRTMWSLMCHIYNR